MFLFLFIISIIMTLCSVNRKVAVDKRLTNGNRRYDMGMSNDNSPLVNPDAVTRIMARMDVESEEARVFITLLIAHYEAGGAESLTESVKEILAHYKELKHI